MIRTLTMTAVVLMFLPAALLRGADAPKGDKSLDGEWEIKSALRGGKEPPADAPKPMLTIEGDKVTVKIGDMTMKATLKADPDKKPKALDMTPEDGPHKGEVIKAIYEVKGDELRVCHGAPGSDRPTEFASKDPGEILAVWTRLKK